MTLQEVLSHLEGVKGSGTQYTAKCPNHGDAHQSLSVSVGKDGKVLLNCHAGCSVEDVVWAMGLQMKDLFTDPPARRPRPEVVATYTYPSGAQKLRRADKSFTWRRHDPRHGWVYNRQGVPHELYVAGELGGVVYVAEGEKDVDSLHSLGCDAASGEDGAGPGKWRKEYTEQLRGCHVLVFQDNDAVGRAYAAETCNALHGVAASVKLLDLSKVWPEIPEHGDVSDLIVRFGPDKASELIAQLESAAPEWTPTAPEYPQKEDKPPDADKLLSLFRPLEDYQEEEARWIVPGWIPAGQITLLAADGGVGKTSLWCNIIAALSSGTTCILDPPGFTRQPMKITFLTTEDSVRKKLRKKLRLAGANMQNIITPDYVGDRSGLLRNLKFGSPEMEMVLRTLKPVLCVFDPVQGFTPPKVNMGSRNEMRDCLAPLISIGEDVDTTALIVSHTNKRKGAYGRDRIADSADLWDIARSVLMAGYTEEQGVRYLSNEKNNYAELQETILFTIDSGEQIRRVGTSWKRDREYIQAADLSRSAPKREDCKEFLLKTLNEAGGAMPTDDLDKLANVSGYSFSTVKRTKAELKREGVVRYYHTGGNDNRVWHIQVIPTDEPVLEDLPEGTPVPFDEPAE